MQAHARPHGRPEIARLGVQTPCGLAGGNFEQLLESLKNTQLRSQLEKSSTYPTREKSYYDSSGWVSENRYASGVFSPAASVDDLFEQP